MTLIAQLPSNYDFIFATASQQAMFSAKSKLGLIDKTMKHFEKKKKLENATMWRLEYHVGDLGFQMRDFDKRKSLDQWAARNDAILVLRTLALIDGCWLPYSTIGKKSVTIDDVRLLLKNMEATYEGLIPTN